MNICIEHNAATLARLTGSSPPACDGVIMPLGRAGDVVAVTLRSNPLGESWLIDAEIPSERIVTWSGTLAEGLFDQHPLTWMSAGHQAFRGFCDEIEPQFKTHSRKLCFHPHSRHVLSDVQSCVNFLRQHETDDSPFEIALAPGSLVEPGMLKDVDDHLRRSIETLGKRCAMVFLHDVIVKDHDGEPMCEPVPLGEGVLPIDLMVELVRANVPSSTPVVILPERMDRQLDRLRSKV